MSEIRASIDIGSNSCLLLVGEVLNGKISKVLESHSYVTSLGLDLDKTGVFADSSMNDTYEALAEYAKIAEKYQIDSSQIVTTATEASRVAKNAEDFFIKVKNEIGIVVQIITSDAEAFYSATGVLCDKEELPDPLFVLDIGGASTELIKLDTPNKTVLSSFSMPVGSVRFTGWEKEDISSKKINSIFENFSKELSESKTELLCCVAGTMTSIANMHLKNPKFIEEEVHGLYMDVQDIFKMKTSFIDYTPEMFLKEFPFLGKRSKTIKAGIAIICLIIEKLEIKKIYISTYGLRYGTLLAGSIDHAFIARK